MNEVKRETPEELDRRLLLACSQDGVNYKNAIKTMKDNIREKYKYCTPDKSSHTFPDVCDLNNNGLLIAPHYCDQDNVRYVTIECNIHHCNESGYVYHVRKSGDFYGSDSFVTLEDAMEQIEKIIYGKKLERSNRKEK